MKCFGRRKIQTTSDVLESSGAECVCIPRWLSIRTGVQPGCPDVFISSGETFISLKQLFRSLSNKPDCLKISWEKNLSPF